MLLVVYPPANKNGMNGPMKLVDLWVDPPPFHTQDVWLVHGPLGLGGPIQVEGTIAKQLVGPILGPGVQSQFGDRVPYSNRTVCLHK